SAGRRRDRPAAARGASRVCAGAGLWRGDSGPLSVLRQRRPEAHGHAVHPGGKRGCMRLRRVNSQLPASNSQKAEALEGKLGNWELGIGSLKRLVGLDTRAGDYAYTTDPVAGYVSAQKAPDTWVKTTCGYCSV